MYAPSKPWTTLPEPLDERPSRPSRTFHSRTVTAVLIALAAIAAALFLLGGGTAGDRPPAPDRGTTPSEPSAAPGVVAADLDRDRIADREPRPSDQETLLRRFLRGHAAPTPALTRVDDATRDRVESAVDAFYASRGDQAAWIGEAERDRARALLAEVAELDRHGLPAEVYGADELLARLDEPPSLRGHAVRELLQLDLDLSRTFALAASDLGQGRVDPTELDLDWHHERRILDLPEVLATLAAGERDGLESLAPRRPEYAPLVAALERYRQLAASGGWQTLPAGDFPEPGEDGERDRLAALAERLRVEGDLATDSDATDSDATDSDATDSDALASAGDGDAGQARYDGELVEAVRRFQERHGLEPDGKIGPSTRAAFDAPVEHRVRQIELGLERLRWLPEPADRRVNARIPAFELSAYDDGAEVVSMRIAAGRKSWGTPSFSGEMSYLVVNPSWNVPQGIATREVIPATRRDPGYLDEEGLEVVDNQTGETVDPSQVDFASLDYSRYRFRQPAGPGNALGRIKFMFPNPFDIYLHDTPARAAFERADRAVSHGCVRLAEPLALAEFVFERVAPEWSMDGLRRQISSRVPQTIPLDEPIRVEIFYLTALADSDDTGSWNGNVRFYRDVYGHDETLDRALADRRSLPRDRETLLIAAR